MKTMKPMNQLTIFYDQKCGVCCQVKAWMQQQPAYVPLRFLAFDDPGALEILPELAKMAADNLKRASIVNATVRQADGSRGLAAEAPFDAIVLSGSVAEVPQALMDLLAVGGRLIAITGDEPMMRATLITRVSDTAFQTAQPWDTVAPRLLHFPQPSRFHF